MSPLDHDELRELLGAFALDAVSDEERVMVESHLARCEECRAEVDRHRGVAAMLARADSGLPDGLWDRVRAGIDEKPGGAVVPLPTRRRLPAYLTAAAAVVLTALVGVQTFRLDRASAELTASQSRLAAIEQAIVEGSFADVAALAADAPGAVTLALSGEAGDGTAILLPNGVGILTSSSFRPLDPTLTYQLWAVLDGEVISAGILGASPSAIPFQIDPDRLEGLVLTAEQAGGVAVSEQPAAAAWFAES